MTLPIPQHIPSHWFATTTVQLVSLYILHPILPATFSSTTLHKEAVNFSTVSVTSYKLPQCYIPEDCNINHTVETSNHTHL